jgi:hypothetical protein
VFIKKSSKKSEKKREKEGCSYFRSPQKYECHSHTAPFDKKKCHSSFAPDFGSGAQEWRSKECRSLTHCIFYNLELSSWPPFAQDTIECVCKQPLIFLFFFLKIDTSKKISAKSD